MGDTTFLGYDLAVQDLAGVGGGQPVTGGVPFAVGTMPAGTCFRLHDAEGQEVPLQTSEVAHWPDGSIAWLLLDFIASVPPDGVLHYRLEQAAPVVVDVPAIPDCQQVGEGDFAMGDGLTASLVLIDGEGQHCRAVSEVKEVEAAGPIRRTTTWRGTFRRPDGSRVCEWRLRVTAWAGLTQQRIEPLLFVDPEDGIYLHLKELRVDFQATTPLSTATLGGDDGAPLPMAVPGRLYQLDDQQFQINGAVAGQRATGWADCGDWSVAVRDFWQQWPKELAATPTGLSVGLLPGFAAGQFAHMQPEHKYQYLFDGDNYRLRDGQTRRWQIWVAPEAKGSDLASMAKMPLLPVLDPAQAAASGAWGAIMPGNREYDGWAEELFQAYQESIERQRDYGAMNWGDWYGERYINWGNHEYDTPWQLLLHYATTGDPRYFHEAELGARHMSEVDTIHHVNPDLDSYFRSNWPHMAAWYPSRPGMVHEHTVGHVSGVYSVDEIRAMLIEAGVEGPKPYACMDPYNLGHIWTWGMARTYCLTGDPFLKETVMAIGLNLACLVEEWQYPFIDNDHGGRSTGWPLLALAGAYSIAPEPRLLAAMKRLVDATLDRQDPNCGGWLWDLPRGHCYCEKPHVGMAGFIVAILINGLSAYYFLTRDERLVSAIDRATTYLNNDTWDGDARDWRYTSCPATPLVNRIGVILQAQVNAYQITGNPVYLRILRNAWTAKFAKLQQEGIAHRASQGLGKTFGVTLYGSLESAALCAKDEQA